MGQWRLGRQLEQPLHQQSLRLVQRLLEQRLLGKQLVRTVGLGRCGLGIGFAHFGLGLRHFVLQSVLCGSVAAATAPFDYSQPVVVNNYVSSDADGGDAAQVAESPATEQATKLFDEGLELFKSGDYKAALAKFDAALKKLPGDPVVHEVRALTLFALGEYKSAAAASIRSCRRARNGLDDDEQPVRQCRRLFNAIP